MDWIPGLLKQLALARSAVVATFVTSIVLYFGPRLTPGYVDPVPKEWTYVVVGTAVFTGCLLLTWLIQGALSLTKRLWSSTSAMFTSYELSQLEVNFLLALAKRPSAPLNIEQVDYIRLNLSRLEVVELINGLQKKDLVYMDMYDENLISLSQIGRTRALEIQRASKHSAV